MLVLIPVVILYSSFWMGTLAFKSGLPVKRWAFAGALIGPVAYPLFNSHKQLAYRKAMGIAAISIEV